MIAIDSSRCAYCGGCVNACPTGALTFHETHLAVDERCTDCGHCLLACPMGALSLSPCESRVPTLSRRRYDVAVIGAGPSGSMAAETAARAGLSVLLLEKRQEIGSPVRCAEGVGHEQLCALVEPDPRWIAAEVKAAAITVLAGDAEPRGLRAEGGRGYVLERRVFDRALAERAAGAGAEVLVKTAATGFMREEGRLCRVRLRQADGQQVEVGASLVIAADGVESQVGRWAGLTGRLPLKDTMVCAQYLLAGIAIDPTCTAYWISEDIAPGGYAWLFPKGEGRANVGLGVQADLWQRRGAPATVLGYLDRFVESLPALARGYPVTLIAGNVPVAPLDRLTADGLMLVGDAARQVDPLTGGGIINAMAAGRLAGQVAAEALAAGDTSAAFLARYAERWQASIGRKLQRNHRLRMRFAPAERADQRFLHAFALAVG